MSRQLTVIACEVECRVLSTYLAVCMSIMIYSGWSLIPRFTPPRIFI